MPTEREKQAEKERVTRISGFRVGYNDFLAEVDLEPLKQRNDRWEAEHRHQARLDRKTEELIRIAAYVAMRNPPHHTQIHVHSAHKAGATPEEICQVIDNAGAGPAGRPGRTGWRPGGAGSHRTPRRSTQVWRWPLTPFTSLPGPVSAS